MSSDARAKTAGIQAIHFWLVVRREIIFLYRIALWLLLLAKCAQRDYRP
jgi:hypothetical protein